MWSSDYSWSHTNGGHRSNRRPFQENPVWEMPRCPSQRWSRRTPTCRCCSCSPRPLTARERSGRRGCPAWWEEGCRPPRRWQRDTSFPACSAPDERHPGFWTPAAPLEAPSGLLGSELRGAVASPGRASWQCGCNAFAHAWRQTGSAPACFHSCPSCIHRGSWTDPPEIKNIYYLTVINLTPQCRFY